MRPKLIIFCNQSFYLVNNSFVTCYQSSLKAIGIQENRRNLGTLAAADENLIGAE